jgi:hypothetical protein
MPFKVILIFCLFRKLGSLFVSLFFCAYFIINHPYGFQDLATVDSILLKELPPVDDADAVIIIFFFFLSYLFHFSQSYDNDHKP